MKAHLLFPDRDFDWQQPPPWNGEALKTDLGLPVLFAAMGGDDEHLRSVAEKVILASVRTDLPTIVHRQGVLQEALGRPSVVHALYAAILDGLEAGRHHYLGSLIRYPDWVLSKSIELMAAYLETLRRLRSLSDGPGRTFLSAGWSNFFSMLRGELDDAFFARVESQLETLRFRHGVLLSARLGKAGKASDYQLHYPPAWLRPNWWRRLRNWVFPPAPPPYSFDVHPLDEAGVRALTDIRKRGMAVVAETIAQAADHVLNFFKMLHSELAFYIGAMNLSGALRRRNVATCTPKASGVPSRLSFRGLYDPALALSTTRDVVGNALQADGASLILVSGANQGGKSTFLRALGLAQVMTQAGLFAPADAFETSLADGLLTHFKREEDAAMESGALDEELGRMSETIDHLGAGSMLLLNESFSSTNEREGSEIGRQVIAALLERGARVVAVTHLYELARAFRDQARADFLFLQPERRPDGTRTFRLEPGEPKPTSFGEDLYRAVFGEPLRPSGVPRRLRQSTGG